MKMKNFGMLMKMVALLLMLMMLMGCSSETVVNPTRADAQKPELNNAEATDPSAVPSDEDAEPTEAEEPTEHTDSDATEETEIATEPAADPKPTEPTTTEPAPTEPIQTEPPHTHSYTDKAVAPTCNDQGYVLHTCSCGESYQDSYSAALGHTFVEEVIAPTTEAQGYTKHTCTRCWYSYNDTFTEQLKVVYDIQQAMDLANAYAASLGFHIDYSLTPSNAGYFPRGLLDGSLITECGGQSYLNSRAQEMAASTAASLADETQYCAGLSYIYYDQAADVYYIYFLYC